VVKFVSPVRPHQAVRRVWPTATFTYNAAGDRVKMDVMQASTALLTRYYLGGQYELDAQSGVERLYLSGDVYSARQFM
jgi:hypothetical protein